ncbi:MAG: hypothetical protein ACJA0S_000755 [Rickettsiales bacterium]|jgi:hypothetical protein
MSVSKLNIAKENLSRAFSVLEKEIFDKISEVAKTDLPAEHALIGIEAQNNKLRIKNEKLEKSQSQKKEIIRQIKTDLSQIKKIIDQ